MVDTKRINRIVTAAASVLALLLSTPSTTTTVFAHGGEDHGGEKAPAVSTTGSMVVRTGRAGDLEVTMKHAPIEPDKETAARVFVTRFDTNEPVANAKITLLFTGSGAPVEVKAGAAGNTAGMYEAKVPPFPQGDYKFVARVEGEGEPQTVEYGTVKVAPAPPAEAESSSTWAHAALIALGSLVGLGVIGFVFYRAAKIARHNQAERRNERETATA